MKWQYILSSSTTFCKSVSLKTIILNYSMNYAENTKEKLEVGGGGYNFFQQCTIA